MALAQAFLWPAVTTELGREVLGSIHFKLTHVVVAALGPLGGSLPTVPPHDLQLAFLKVKVIQEKVRKPEHFQGGSHNLL